MKHVFCTYFDHRYLPRGLALIASLRRHDSNDDVWVLCLNQACHDVLSRMALPGVHLLRIADLEAAYPKLLDAKAERSTIEYYFTCSPQLVRFLFDQQPELEAATYLDADLYFFDKVSLFFQEIGDAPVAITPHKYPQRIKHMEKFGIYNVSSVFFRRNDEGMKCLTWWAERCLEWCFDEPQPDGRFADQGYLNWFPEIAPNVKVLDHPGINLAPWNVGNYKITQCGGRISVAGQPLIFFHFHGMRHAMRWFYFSHHTVYRAPLGRVLRNFGYRPYVGDLVGRESSVAAILDTLPKEEAVLKRGGEGRREVTAKDVLRNILRFAYKLSDIARGRAILVIGKTVY